MARVPLICVLLAVGLTFCWAADDAGLRRTLSDLAQKTAVKALKDKKFVVAEFGFRGTLEAVAPDKNVKVEVQEFSLGNDTVKSKFRAAGLFRLAGKYAKDGASTDLDALFSLDITPSVEVPIVKRGDDFFVKPTVTDLEFTVELKEVQPAALAEGKALIASILNAAYKTQKESILKAVNAALVEKKL